MVLRFLGKPLLARHEKFHLLKIRLHDFWGELSDEVLGKLQVILLQRRRELRWTSVSVEQTTEDAECPLLSLPPFTLLAVIFILRNTFSRDMEVDNLEEETTPWDDTFRCLLVLAQSQNDAVTVCLKDVMQDGRDILRRSGRGRFENLVTDSNKKWECLFHNLHHDFRVLPVPKVMDMRWGHRKG